MISNDSKPNVQDVEDEVEIGPIQGHIGVVPEASLNNYQNNLEVYSFQVPYKRTMQGS